MASIYNTVVYPGGIPNKGSVEIWLIWEESVADVAKDSEEENTLVGSVHIGSEGDGSWQIDNLDLNTEITPANVYMITETLDDVSVTYFVNLTAEGTFWVGDVLTPRPAWYVDETVKVVPGPKGDPGAPIVGLFADSDALPILPNSNYPAGVGVITNDDGNLHVVQENNTWLDTGRHRGINNWGDIVGTIADQADLNSELTNLANDITANTLLTPIQAHILWRTQTTLSTASTVSGPTVLPAGSYIIVDGQNDSNENGIYQADGFGGLALGSRQDVTVAANEGRLIVVQQVEGERSGESGSTFTALEPFIGSDVTDSKVGGLYHVISPDNGSTFKIESLDGYETKAHDLSDWFTAAMDSYSIGAGDTDVDDDYQMTFMHGVVMVDTSGGNVNLILPPHSTVARLHFVWHKVGGNTLTIKNYPADGTAFSQVVPSGERLLVLQDGTEWNAWKMPQTPAEIGAPSIGGSGNNLNFTAWGDATTVVDSGVAIDDVKASLGYSRTFMLGGM